jgi:hypothetical protein
MRLANQESGVAITVPARIVFDDLMFESSERDGVDFALVVGPPGMLPPGGRETLQLDFGQTIDISIEDFTFNWQHREPAHYRFTMKVNAGGYLSSSHSIEFSITTG